jgi:hypothetical protein
LATAFFAGAAFFATAFLAKAFFTIFLTDTRGTLFPFDSARHLRHAWQSPSSVIERNQRWFRLQPLEVVSDVALMGQSPRSQPEDTLRNQRVEPALADMKVVRQILATRRVVPRAFRPVPP